MKVGTNGPGYLPMRAVTHKPTSLESHAIGGAERTITQVIFHLGKFVLLARLFSLVT